MNAVVRYSVCNPLHVPVRGPARNLLAALALFVAALALLAPPAAARDEGIPMPCPAPAAGPTDPCARSPTSLGTADGPDLTAANPVNPLTGAKYQEALDAPPLPGPMGLEIRRHYNSRYAGHDGGLGRGWSLSWDTRLYPPARPGGLIQIIQGDGRRHDFRAPAADDLAARLHRDGPLDCTTGSEGSGRLVARADGWLWVWPDRHTLRFSPDGTLVSAGPIDARPDELLRFEQDPAGRLVRVIDPAGRRMTLARDIAGRITRIDHPLGSFNYRYATDGSLVAAQGPDGITRRYRYDDIGLRGYLTGIVAEAPGQSPVTIGRWQYDADGRVRRFVRGDGSHIDFTYEEPEAGLRVTRMRNGNGAETRYVGRFVAGAWRLVESDGPGCAECAPTGLRFAYDTRGRVIARWLFGRDGVAFERDLQGRVVAARSVPWPENPPAPQGLIRAGTAPRQPDARPPAARQPAAPGTPLWRIEYGDTFTSLPVRIVRPGVVPGRWAVLAIERDARGRPVRVDESGYSPTPPTRAPSSTTPAARPALSAAVPDAEIITRSRSFRYGDSGGRSVLAASNGPAPDGPTGSPADSDVLAWTTDPATGLWQTETRPDGQHLEVLERDAGGRVVRLSITDGNRRVVLDRQLDLHGRATRETLHGWLLDDDRQPVPGSERRLAVSRAYDVQGHLVHETDPAGRSRRIEYDRAGRAVGWQSGSGHRVGMLRDAEGWPLRYALHRPDDVSPWRALYLQRDAAGRIVGQLLPDGRWQRRFVSKSGQQWLTFDSDGALRWQDQTDRITVDAADAVNTLGPANAIASPDTADRRQPGITRLVDDFGRTVAEHTADHGWRTRTYDAASRLITATDGAGATIRFRHDHAGRLLESWHDTPGGPTLLARYHWNGTRLAAVDEPAVHTRHDHDGFGRVIRTRSRFAALAERDWIVETGHDPRTGLESRRRLPDGQRLLIERHESQLNTTNDVIDSTGIRALRLRSAGWAWLEDRIADLLPAGIAGWLIDRLPARTVADDIRFDPFDGLQGWRHGNGLRSQRQFDRAGRLQRQRVTAASPGPTLLHNVYHYRNGPRIERVVDRGPGGGAVRFDYDRYGRLAGAIREAADGTVTAIPLPATTALPAARPDTASPGAGTALRDTGGRLLHSDPHRYRYTAHGQLAAIDRATDGRPIARFAYNHQRQRVLRQTFDPDAGDADGQPRVRETTAFLWHRGRVAAEIDSQGRIRRQYLYLTDGAIEQPLALLDTDDRGRTRLLAIHTDHRGAPVAVTDNRRQTVWRADSQPFGEAMRVSLRHESRVGTDASARDGFRLDLRLPGQIEDPVTGLVDNHHRTYDPRRGRYLQPDPLGYPDGPDPWRYAAGDPVNRSDPDGLYQRDMHYTMTFFLAVTAGYSFEDARIVATASQYVDDNPLTRPVDPTNLATIVGSMTRNQQQLQLMHFVLSDQQAGPTFGTTLPEYRNDQVTIADSPQLQRLRNAASHDSLTRIGQLVFQGTYLHAVMDTASHRDINNLPFDALVRIASDCYGLGHGHEGHEPDKTYDSELVLVPGEDGQPGRWIRWEREARALSAEQMVHERLVELSTHDGQTAEFEAIRPWLERFNAIREDDGTGFTQKTALIEEALVALGYGSVNLREAGVRNTPLYGYSLEEAKQRFAEAMNNLNGHPIREEDFPGVCIQGGNLCSPVQ